MGVEERNNFYELFNAAGMTLNRNEKRFLDKRIESFNKNIEAALLFQEDEIALRKIIENLDNLEPFEKPDCCLLIDENEKGKACGHNGYVNDIHVVFAVWLQRAHV